MNPIRAQRNHLILFMSVVSLSMSVSMPGAMASVNAQQTNVVQMSSVIWRAVATLVDTPPSNTALILPWSINRGDAHQLFDVVNTGTIDISSQSFSVKSVLDTNGNVRSPTVTLDACIGGIWVAIDSCSGTVVRLGNSLTEFFTVNIPLPIDARIHIQASTTPSGSSSYTTTINISVARTSVRSGQTSNL